MNNLDYFIEAVKNCRKLYKQMILEGIPVEQARNIMPMGTFTKIVMVTNLKELIGYVRARTSKLTQDDHVDIVHNLLIELKTKCPEFHKIITGDKK